MTPPTAHQRRILTDVAAGRSLSVAGYRFGFSSKTGLAMSRTSLVRRGWLTTEGEITTAGREAIAQPIHQPEPGHPGPTTMTTTPEQLRAALEAAYPPTATCWSQATDEVRDMSRCARTMLGLPENSAIRFREIETPAEWNTKGINSIVGWYARMQPEMRATFLKRIKGLY